MDDPGSADNGVFAEPPFEEGAPLEQDASLASELDIGQTALAITPPNPLCSAVCGPTASCTKVCDRIPGERDDCAGYGACRGDDQDGDGVPYERDNCPLVSNPGQEDCDRDGRGNPCDTDPPIWAFDSWTFMLCHFDPDRSISGYDVEIYTADRYRDRNCTAPVEDHFRRREVASVHCGFNSESECARRVAAEAATLAGQGYFPTVSEPGIDACPYPRL